MPGVIPVRRPRSRISNGIQPQSFGELRRVSSFPAFLVLMGVVISSDLELSVGGAKLTAGRIGILLLLFPAIFKLFRSDRRLLLSDFFALATGIWTVGAAIYVDGTASLSSAGAEALELVGAYFVARGVFFGPAALSSFIRWLKIFTLGAIVIGLADNLSGRWVVPEMLTSFFQVPALIPQMRSDFVRATSAFSHPILFGVFCAQVAGILLYSETKVLNRILCASVCLFGCMLSLSSAALMSFAMVLAAYLYNRQMAQYPWRWKVLVTGLATLLLMIVATTNHPLGWLLSHLTLDPESAYFRLLIWDLALDRIAEAPLAGYAFTQLNNYILDSTVDSAWLVYSLRFGVPMTAMLLLTNVSAFLPSGRGIKNRREQSHMDDMRTAFTMVLLMFIFTGLTAHFWNYIWIFWGLCIGIRASLREWEVPAHRHMEIPGPEGAPMRMINSPSVI